MKKLTICIIIGLVIYSLFITINYNKLKLENANIKQENTNIKQENESLNRPKIDVRGSFRLEKTDFEMQIINNPIASRISDATTTGEIIGAAAETIDLWYKEIEYSLNQSKEYLSEEEYNELIKSQKIWEDYMTSERVSYPLPDDDSGYSRIMKIEEEKSRVRQRAIDLMAYLYALKMYAGEEEIKVDFYYNKEKEIN